MHSLLKRNLFLLLIIPAIGIFLWQSNNDIPAGEPSAPVPAVKPEVKKPVKESAVIMVDVKGAVTRPGVYEMPPGARVKDVIDMAGGLTADADQKMVNLAQKIHDEMLIYIPVKGEVVSSQVTGSTGNEKVRINYADQAEIETLNGIGPSKAAAIIQYREENGLFKSIEGLLEVPGIGEKTLENLKESIQVP